MSGWEFVSGRVPIGVCLRTSSDGSLSPDVCGWEFVSGRVFVSGRCLCPDGSLSPDVPERCLSPDSSALDTFWWCLSPDSLTPDASGQYLCLNGSLSSNLSGHEFVFGWEFVSGPCLLYDL